MAIPMSDKNQADEMLNRFLTRLKIEFRRKAQHPNAICNIELDQLKNYLNDLNKKYQNIEYPFYKNFTLFKKDFDYLADHPNILKQKFEDMILQFFKYLK